MKRSGLRWCSAIALGLFPISVCHADFNNPIVFIRDAKQDFTDIRSFFADLDHIPRSAIIRSDQGIGSDEEFSHYMKYRDGKKDEVPLEVSRIRRLGNNNNRFGTFSYVVYTARSAWFDRGGSQGSYENIGNTWLVSFSNCKIRTIREVPELSYLAFERM